MTDRKLPPIATVPPAPNGIPKYEGERILAAMAQLEGKLLEHVGEIREDVSSQGQRIEKLETAVQSNVVNTQAVEGLRTAIGTLGDDVRSVLRRDVNQEERIAALERQAIAEGKQAGQRAGVSAGAATSIIATIIVYVIQGLIHPLPPTVPPPEQRRPLQLTPVPGGP